MKMNSEKIPKIILSKNLNDQTMEDEACSERRDIGISRADSFSSCSEGSTAESRRELKRKRRGSISGKEDGDTVDDYMSQRMEKIRKEREFLESFLFNENNKVNKSVMRIVMNKWNLMENELYKAMVENVKLKTKVEEIERFKEINNVTTKRDKTRTYADAAKQGSQYVECMGNRKQTPSDVILIRPLKEGDKRSNEDIKSDLCKELKNNGSKIKIKAMRQMRKNGIIVEVDGEEDCEMINVIKLDKIGLKAERPKKQKPLIMIYDIEKDMNKDDIVEDLILKNMDIDKNDARYVETQEEIKIVHMFKIRNTDRNNVLIETNAVIYNKLINKDRVYIGWRTHRVREYINLTRCYRCYGYGHAAKNCRLKSQLCEKCGEEGHVKDKCREESPTCINCKRNRRKDIKHQVKSPTCPVYIRQVQTYKDRIDWS